MHEACGIEQDVDLADAFCHLSDGRGVAHVKLCDLRHALPGERRETLFVDIGCKNRGTFTRKSDGACAANACRARGHERALAL